jgi:hypothetical protein
VDRSGQEALLLDVLAVEAALVVLLESLLPDSFGALEVLDSLDPLDDDDDDESEEPEDSLVALVPRASLR